MAKRRGQPGLIPTTLPKNLEATYKAAADGRRLVQELPGLGGATRI